MKIFKKIISVILVLLICILCSCQNNADETVEPPAATGEFSVNILKAGQADATLLKTENHSIIVDCGEKDDGGKIIELLRKEGISNVDYILITHFDKDHVGGFPELIENITADNVVVPNYEGGGSAYKKYVSAIEENNISPIILTEKKTFVLDDVLFEIFPPQKTAYSTSDNDFSLVLSVTHGENTFLFAGDAEAERTEEIISEFGRHYDFLKVPHHGRFNKNTGRFFSTVKPRYAVITDSDKNPADEETTSLLEKSECLVYSTKNGDVYVVSDGEEIKIMQ